jgi:hypothetical protein
LDARGYDPLQPRFTHADDEAGSWDLVMLWVAGVVTAGIVGGRLTYLLYTSDLVYHPSLRFVYAWVREWV